MVVTRAPRCLQAIFTCLRSGLTKPQFGHVCCLLLALVLTGRPKLRHVAQATSFGRHRTAVGHFLSQSDWDERSLLARQALQRLRAMKPRKGECVYLLIDDTRIAKRGRKMDDVSKLWDHAHQCFTRGHTVVVAALHFRGVTLPWRLRVWQAKDWAGAKYQKPTEIAAELVGEFVPPPGLKVRVLFDAFYLCPTLTRACQSQGFTWFSVASKNRRLKRTGRGKSGRLCDLGPGVLRHQGRRVRLRRSPGWRWMRIASIEGRLAKIGAVRIVFSKRPRDPWKKLLAVATNETRRTAREIIAIYEKRWHIEVLFKELRGSFGLGDYQMRTRKGITRHLHLCCLAHLTLTHHSLRAVGAQATTSRTEIPLPPFRERLAALRQQIRNDQIQNFVSRIKHDQIRKRVREFLLAS